MRVFLKTIKTILSGVFFLTFLLFGLIVLLFVWLFIKIAYIGLTAEKRLVLKNLYQIRETLSDSLSDDEDLSRAFMASQIAGSQILAMQLENMREHRTQRRKLLRKASQLKIPRWRLAFVVR